MASRPSEAERPVQVGAWGRCDALLFALAVTTLVLTVVQFALAGLGAFAMDRTPPSSDYGAHAAVGTAIGVLTLLMLATVLVSRRARAHRTTLWLTVVLAVLSVAQPALAAGGRHVPAVGALHALAGTAILAAVGWLTWETARRRAEAGTTLAAARTRADPP